MKFHGYGDFLMLTRKLPDTMEIRVGSSTINCPPNTVNTLDFTNTVISAFGWSNISVLVPVLHSSIPQTLHLSNMGGKFYVYNNSTVPYNDVMITYIAVGK